MADVRFWGGIVGRLKLEPLKKLPMYAGALRIFAAAPAQPFWYLLEEKEIRVNYAWNSCIMLASCQMKNSRGEQVDPGGPRWSQVEPGGP